MKGVSERLEGALMTLSLLILGICIIALSYRLTYEIHRYFHDKLHAEMKEGAKC